VPTVRAQQEETMTRAVGQVTTNAQVERSSMLEELGVVGLLEHGTFPRKVGKEDGVQNNPKTPHVVRGLDSVVLLRPHKQLWSHVRGGSDRGFLPLDSALCCQAKICELGTAALQQHVLGLEVTVHNTFAVHVGKPAANVAHVATSDHLVKRVRVGGDGLEQITAVCVLYLYKQSVVTV